MRPFQYEARKELPEWIIDRRILEKAKLDHFTKWNHAYGIPIFGIESFSDDSMRRACYLVR